MRSLLRKGVVNPEGTLDVFSVDRAGDGERIAELLDDVAETGVGSLPLCTRNS